VARRHSARVERLAARLLGARHLALALPIVLRPSGPWPRRAAAVDALHAASMLLFARVDRRRARPAAVSAALAASWSIVTVTVDRVTPPLRSTPRSRQSPT
jgi:hypothetical protein